MRSVHGDDAGTDDGGRAGVGVVAQSTKSAVVWIDPAPLVTPLTATKPLCVALNDKPKPSSPSERPVASTLLLAIVAAPESVIGALKLAVVAGGSNGARCCI